MIFKRKENLNKCLDRRSVIQVNLACSVSLFFRSDPCWPNSYVRRRTLCVQSCVDVTSEFKARSLLFLEFLYFFIFLEDGQLVTNPRQLLVSSFSSSFQVFSFKTRRPPNRPRVSQNIQTRTTQSNRQSLANSTYTRHMICSCCLCC